MPSKKLEPTRVPMASVNIAIPCTDSGLIVATASKNGCALVMNSLRFLPISGRPDVSPAPKPPIMLPTKSPIA